MMKARAGTSHIMLYKLNLISGMYKPSTYRDFISLLSIAWPLLTYIYTDD